MQREGGENKTSKEQKMSSDGPSEADWEEYYRDEEARQVAARELPNLGRLTPKATENLDRNARLRNSSRCLKLEAGQKVLLIFDPEKIESMGTEYLYTVIYPKTSNRDIFPIGPYDSEVIDSHLRRGRNILQIHNVGTRDEPEYVIT